MTDTAVWNDKKRADLRELLRDRMRGEVRLAQSGHDDIIQMLREVFIDEEVPEDERAEFVQFADEELKKAEIEHAKEQATWPDVTDCDRLDEVEAALLDQGIVLWQASPCCDSCTGGDFPYRLDEIERRHPGSRAKIRGYAFFIDQNMADSLAEDTNTSVWLGYGWYSPDDSEVADEVYKEHALGIAREIHECLKAHGFKTDWDGSFSRKIGVFLNWQRRTLLQ